MSNIKTVKKPWGREIWFAYTNGKYVGKVLEINKGCRLSMQYHNRKEETFYIIQGKVHISYGKSQTKLKNRIFKSGSVLHLPPKTIHRVEAMDDTKIIEVSTPHLTDIVRISDDYNRVK